MKPTFERSEGRDGVRIVDPVESRRLDCYTPEPVTPTPVDASSFAFPVDAAVSISTTALRVPVLTDVFVRTVDGDHVADATNAESLSVPRGRYVLEVSGTPMKLYLCVEAAVSVTPDGDAVEVSFGKEASVRMGARSFHEQPAGTITVGDGVRDAMRAVSHLGSALKTLSPERSYPTLRGHPPLVERGDEFSVPAGVERPDSGVRLELPVAWEALYPAVPLAYYLGAEVLPGTEPRLVTDEGFVHRLDAPDGYQAEVGRMLRQTFLLDCATRTEGLYRVPVHERECVESRVDLDFAACYDLPLAARVERYLDVPFETVADLVPEWPRTTDVVPSASNVGALPFLADDLALVRCPTSPASASVSAPPRELASFFRGDDVARSAESASVTDASLVEPVESVSTNQAWVGDGVALGATNATMSSYRRRAEAEPTDRKEIRVVVVCNDEQMRREGVVESLYGDRDRLAFDVTLARDLTVDELASAFASDGEFLHYVGHVDDRGFQCADGVLDARDLDSVGVDAFLLNACSSYEQGAALVERGALGGVVTLRPVGNEGATRLGRTFARLLNRGFPLSVALSVARDESLLGNQYVVIGDGDVSLVQTESPFPLVLSVEPVGDRFELSIWVFPSTGAGGTVTPNVADNTMRYLNMGTAASFELSASELDEFLNREPMPVRTDDGLVYSTEVTAADFRR
jgi:hypothetical protein